MPIDLKDSQIDRNDPKYQTMLENLQGNILKVHGRNFAVHIFVKFTAPPDIVKGWMRNFTEQFVTSAKKQLDETHDFKTFGIPGELFCNLFLSSKGYEYILGLSQEELASLFPEADDTNVKFLNGMEASQQELNDPSPQTWEAGYRGRQIHAMIMLADENENFLLRQARRVLFQVRAVGQVLAVERGRALRNKKGIAIEQFGYADGVSQPLFLKSDIEQEQQKAGGIDKWNPSAPLELALIKDPNVDAEDCFGSYLVFRKLEENVRGFKQREQDLADALGLKDEDRERAGALVVGRFEDGTPVVSSPNALDRDVPPNNFKYDLDDPEAMKCPFHAHIRKTNPRGDISKHIPIPPDEEKNERSRRIVRRGITYGIRTDDPNGDIPPDQRPSKDVGLLFMCFQSSIPHQFGFMQKSWANNVDFVKEGTGRDPVIGQKGNNESKSQTWPVSWGNNTETKQFDFGEFVTLKGGEFFFAPSIPFLKSL